MAGFEPTTSCSQSRRDTGLRYTPKMASIFFCKTFASASANFCRGGRIRTYDLLLPKQARYRATLHPELGICFPFYKGWQSNGFKMIIPFICQFNFAERAGFEPAVPLPVRQFSKLFLSASQAPLLFPFNLSYRPCFEVCKYSKTSYSTKKNYKTC